MRMQDHETTPVRVEALLKRIEMLERKLERLEGASAKRLTPAIWNEDGSAVHIVDSRGNELARFSVSADRSTQIDGVRHDEGCAYETISSSPVASTQPIAPSVSTHEPSISQPLNPSTSGSQSSASDEELIRRRIREGIEAASHDTRPQPSASDLQQP